MEQQTTFDFTEREQDVISEALKMYASYMRMQTDFLVGDESDADEVYADANTSKRLARAFHNATQETNWEEEERAFQQHHDRPMDVHDWSKFDFFAHYEGSQ